MNKILSVVIISCVLISSVGQAQAFGRSSRGHSFMTHGLAAGGGALLGYMAGRASSEPVRHEVVEEQVVQTPRTVVVQEQPRQPVLTDCSMTRKAPIQETDGLMHEIFIKDCVIQ